MSVGNKIKAFELAQAQLEIKKNLAIEKALRSNDPAEIIKANLALKRIQSKMNLDNKSYLVDPFEFKNSFGFKDKRMGLSYGHLRGMAKTPVINAILRTRLNQVAAFAEPQKDEFSVGYKIRKKPKPGLVGKEELTTEDERIIDELTMFIENCGDGNIWGGDDFDAFVRKFMRDSLTLDQGVFEIVPDSKGIPREFYAVDGGTFRVADDYENRISAYNDQNKPLARPEKVNGYYPSHVQIYNQKVMAEFYPWELCFGLRNPSSSVYNYGYGISELEELISVVTALLWGEEYNRNFFKQGSAPKGIIKVNGNFSDARLAEFRQQWNATIRGVQNSWKTPVLEADKVDWIDLQRTNRDMEFTNWIEFLIKVSCAIYTIDPAEVNFPLKGSANSTPMFEGSNEARIKHSKDKGLYPLLKFLQKRINKYIIERINPNFEFMFVGLDSMTPKEQAEYDKILLETRKTYNEIREMRGDEPIDEDWANNIGSPTVAQFKQMDQMANMGMEGEEPYEEGYEDDQAVESMLDQDTVKGLGAGNPFVSALNNYLEKGIR